MLIDEVLSKKSYIDRKIFLLKVEQIKCDILIEYYKKIKLGCFEAVGC